MSFFSSFFLLVSLIEGKWLVQKRTGYVAQLLLLLGLKCESFLVPASEQKAEAVVLSSFQVQLTWTGRSESDV